MKMENFDKRTEEQKEALRLLNHATMVRQVAQNNGDTSSRRRELSSKEAQKIKTRRKQARASRKLNRKGGR